MYSTHITLMDIFMPILMPEAEARGCYKDAASHEQTAIHLLLTNVCSINPEPSMSSSSHPSVSAPAQPDIDNSLTVPQRRKTPWRRYTTSTDTILSHGCQGQGTETDPYIVEWLPDDQENPLNWKSVCHSRSSLREVHRLTNVSSSHTNGAMWSLELSPYLG